MGVKQIIIEGCRTHPAVEAWAAATSAGTLPESVHVLRERPTEAVYLLAGVAPGGASVIAKRALPARTVIERTVYENILPRLPLTAPRCYGSWINEPDGWLFMENAGVERYSRTDPEHLALAARWLGIMHTTARRVPAARSLPDGGPARYLSHLRRGRDRIFRSLDTYSYAPAEVEDLMATVARCAALEARWDRVEQACNGVPATVVHGDFQSKNVYLRTDRGSLGVLPIDWETVGWGSPAADLADLHLPRVDLPTYWTVVREFWPDVDLRALERLAAIGGLLSGCAEFDWKCATLLQDRAPSRSSAIVRIGRITGLVADAAHATDILG
jgi:hypothetical protein